MKEPRHTSCRGQASLVSDTVEGTLYRRPRCVAADEFSLFNVRPSG